MVSCSQSGRTYFSARNWSRAIAALAMCWAAPGWATDGARAEEIPGVRQGEAVESAKWLGWTEGNLVRRADVPGRFQGEVTLGGNTAAPGKFGGAPDANLAARVGLGYGVSAEVTAQRSASGLYRPGVGAKWQFRQRAQGLNLAVMGLFRPEGFNEPEGEVELQFIGSYRAGRSQYNFNAVVGGAPDGKDRDAEAILGGGYRLLSNLFVGGEARSRMALGTKLEAWGVAEHVAGAVAQMDIKGFTLTGLLGGGAFQASTSAPLNTGLYGQARIGYRF